MAREEIVIVVREIGADRTGRKIRGVGSSATRASKGVRLLKRELAALGGLLAVRELTRLSDAFTNMQNRLRLVTRGTKSLNDVTEELFNIANRTRSSFEATADLYARVALAARELGRSQQELLEFTESVNQAIILSGASAQEASAGLIQLAQGLASNRLSGDELRSVLEQLPLIADVIAKQLGVTRGELRKLGEQGQLTADIILDSFKSSRLELEQRFGKTVATIAQNFQVFRNNLIKAVQEVDNLTGIFTLLSMTIKFVATNLVLLTRLIVIGTAAWIAYRLSLIRTAAVMGPLSKLAQALSFSYAVLTTSTVAATASQQKLKVALLAVQRAFPLLLLVAFIVSLVAFRNEITLTEDGVVSLNDLMTEIGITIADVANDFRNFLIVLADQSGFDALVVVLSTLKFSFFDLLLTVASFFDAIILAGRGVGSIFVIIFKNIEDTITLAFAVSINKAIKGFAKLVEVSIRVQNKIRSFTGQDPLDFGIVETIKQNQLEVPKRIDDLGTAIAEAWTRQTKKIGPTAQAVIDIFQRIRDKISLRNAEDPGGASAGDSISEFTKGLKQGLGEVENSFIATTKNVSSLVVGLFNDMSDALSDFVLNGKFNFKSFADSVVKDITRIIVQQQILGPLAKGFGGLFGGAGGGTEAPLSLDEVVPLAGGGLVGGIGTGTSDSNLAALSRGEFVVNASDTNKNLAVLKAINAGSTVASAAPSRAAAPTRSAGGTSGPAIFAPVINVSVESSGEDSSEAQGDAIGRAINIALRKQYVLLTQEQQRNGGMLNPQTSF